MLKHYPNSRAFCFGGSYDWLEQGKINLEEGIDLAMRKNPEVQGRIFPADGNVEKISKTKMLYSIFLADTYHVVLPVANKHEIPFAFTLYPDGGFQPDDEVSDEQLRAVFSSKNFKKVIVTQKVAEQYLIRKKLCSKENIELIYGHVAPDIFNIEHNKYYGEKSTLDIAFVANNYGNVKRKGFDIFCEVAKKLGEKDLDINFHVVGTHTKQDYDVGDQSIIFHGSMSQAQLHDFYKDIDIIVSPTLGMGNNGVFDGFPLGSQVEAAAVGVAMFATDELKMNRGRFKSGRDIEIVKHNVNYIAKKINYYLRHPEKLVKLATRGKERVRELYSYEAQMLPRYAILDECLQSVNSQEVV